MTFVFPSYPVVLAAILLAGSALGAQRTTTPYRPPFEGEQVDLPRSANGTAYRLFIRKPLRDPLPGERAIAIYVLDAQWNFPAVATTHANIESLGHVPPIYYIGVSYQDETPGEAREANRTRDYTPTAFRPADPASHFLKPEDYEGSGGADAFLDVLAREVIPYVQQHYPVDSATRGIVGKSMSGLLATYALLRRPELFSHYLIISPALWWDDYYLDFRDRAVMRQERATHDERLTQPRRVWIGMGDGEERLGMLADVYVLGRELRLRNDPQLELTIKLLHDEVHESMFAAGFAAGLRALFPRRAR